jgi:hypothetical protein
MPAYHYRITGDMLEQPTGEEGLQSLSFFASTPHDLFAEASQLRHRLGCSACIATRLATVRCLLAEESAVLRPSSSLVLPTEA